MTISSLSPTLLLTRIHYEMHPWISTKLGAPCSPTPNVPRSNINPITWWSDQHSAVETSPSITKWLSESVSKIMCQRFDGHFLLSPRWPLWGGSFVIYLIRKLFIRWYLSVTLTRWSWGNTIFFIISLFFRLEKQPSIDHWLNTLRIARKYLTKLYIFKFRDHFVDLHLQKNSK